jgi:hypothetical protein
MNIFFTSTIQHCKIVGLPKIHNRAGNLTALNNDEDIPFEIKRVYYLYDIPCGETRGGHAHRELYQLIIAASGSFDVVLNDGKHVKAITLNRPDTGIYIVPGIWRDLRNFSSGSICLVLASIFYDQDDYIRDYVEFINYKKHDSSNI